MPTRRAILAGGLGCLALARPALSLPALSRPMVRVPIEVTQTGLAIISADIDGHRLRFVIDTGAETSAIRRDLVASLGLKRVGRRRDSGADGGLIVTDYEAKKVVFGGAVHVAEMALAAIPGLTAFDGLLAAGFLTAYPSELDYGAREIRIHPGAAMDLGGYSPIEARVVRRDPSLSPRFYCPFSIDGLSLSAMLDTGFETEVFLNAGLVGRHGLWDRFPIRGEKVFRGIAGKRLVTRVVEMPNFRLGAIERRSVLVTLADPVTRGIPAIGRDDGVIGASLLKRFSIAFDGAGGLGFKPNV